MKFVIYFICFFVVSMIVTMFRSKGVILGALPTMALYLVAGLIGQGIIKMWENNHPKDK